MELSKKVVLVGGGGHCSAVADIVMRGGEYEIVGVVDLKEPEESSFAYLGSDDELPALAKRGAEFIITVGQIKSTKPRRGIHEILDRLSARFPVVVCPTAVVARSARLGPGTVVFPQAVVGANVVVGSHCILNSGSIIEHDSVVGDFSHVSTAATVNGACSVGCDTFIGSGATLRESISVGDGCVIGACSYVGHDVPDNRTVYGVPARNSANRC